MNISRRCLHVEEWPQSDQALWHAATTKGSIFDDTGPAALWRAPTLDRTRQGYGRWLSYLISSEQMHDEQLPHERITPDNVRQYVLCLQEQVQPWTTWSYMLSLWVTARLFRPDDDWGWLYTILAKLQLKRRPASNKRARMQPAGEIARWALRRLDTLNQSPIQGAQDALAYRNTLMIAILINCPIRLRNLSMIRIDKHLVFDGARYRLDFEPAEVKTDRYLSCTLPENLTPHLSQWLNHLRPRLMAESDHDAFWVGIRGAPMRPRGIYGCVISTTEAAFGVSINPHLFRDIAVSWIIDMDPAHAGITSPMLGHTNPRTTEEHYIQANQALAVRRYGQSVSALRDRLTDAYGDPYKNRNPS